MQGYFSQWPIVSKFFASQATVVSTSPTWCILVLLIFPCLCLSWQSGNGLPCLPGTRGPNGVYFFPLVIKVIIILKGISYSHLFSSLGLHNVLCGKTFSLICPATEVSVSLLKLCQKGLPAARPYQNSFSHIHLFCRLLPCIIVCNVKCIGLSSTMWTGVVMVFHTYIFPNSFQLVWDQSLTEIFSNATSF